MRTTPACRARRAGMREALQLNDGLERTLGVRLANRIGVHTGEVVAGDPTRGSAPRRPATRSTPRPGSSRPRGRRRSSSASYLSACPRRVEASPSSRSRLKGKAERVPAFRPRARTLTSGARQRPPLVGPRPSSSRSAIRRMTARRRVRASSLLITWATPAWQSRSRPRTPRDSRRDQHLLTGAGVFPYGQGITSWPLRRGAAARGARHR